MPERPIIVFDVSETLLDLQAIRPVFDRIFSDPAAMRLWFAGLITYSEALTLAGVYVPFTGIGSAVLQILAAAHGITISDAESPPCCCTGACWCGRRARRSSQRNRADPGPLPAVGIARLPGLAYNGLTELAGGAEWPPGPAFARRRASSSGEDARPVTGTVLAVDAGRTAAL
ncbi:MAG: hypothetical protein WBF34_07195 [Streptosporangiaceae bacterium]